MIASAYVRKECSRSHVQRYIGGEVLEFSFELYK